ncbi:hypothetical protein SHKM778_53540 [Streptomyces sp. KM77-8]|uniref:Cytochrome P450 n=1 Tax=Streptomyces haneummycinicus TaxID=3074435 RepID=A0AAT9HNP8_9ACTN
MRPPWFTAIPALYLTPFQRPDQTGSALLNSRTTRGSPGRRGWRHGGDDDTGRTAEGVPQRGAGLAGAAPHPRPPYRLPLLGDLIGASGATPVQDSLKYARRLGPIFRRSAFGREFVFTWGADLVAELADESRFAKHVGLGIANLRPVAGDGLFTAYNHEPNWQLAHDVLAPGFSREAMAGYHPMMLSVAERLTEHWDLAAAGGRPVDVPGDMTRLTLETIARTGFGHDFGSFERARPHPFVSAMVGTLSHAQRLNSVPGPLAPLLLRRAGRRNAADIALLERVVDEVVRERRASGGGDGDLLDRMLETAHPETGERLSAENVRRQVITFLVAGHETTSGALSFALHHLSLRPDVAERARAEVDRVWGRWPRRGTSRWRSCGMCGGCWTRRCGCGLPRRPSRGRLSGTRSWGCASDAAGAWTLVLTPMLHRDAGVWGPTRSPLIRAGSRRGRSGACAACVQAVRDGGAGVYRTAVRAARGGVGAGVVVAAV